MSFEEGSKNWNFYAVKLHSLSRPSCDSGARRPFRYAQED
jgi:hypothetical protein